MTSTGEVTDSAGLQREPFVTQFLGENLIFLIGKKTRENRTKEGERESGERMKGELLRSCASVISASKGPS